MRPGAAGGRFSLSAFEAPAGVATLSRASASSALAGLLAIQSEGDGTERRRKAVRRGFAVLDALDRLKLAALSGHVSTADLKSLGSALREDDPGGNDPALADLIGQIELRAEVEIAKLSRA